MSFLSDLEAANLNPETSEWLRRLYAELSSQGGAVASATLFTALAPGVYNVVVPEGVTRIYATCAASGGGGGGGVGAGAANFFAGGGGGGGAGSASLKQPLTVEPGETLTITIPSGGLGGAPGVGAGAGTAGTAGSGVMTINGSVSGALVQENPGSGGSPGSGGVPGVGGAGGGGTSAQNGHNMYVFKGVNIVGDTHTCGGMGGGNVAGGIGGVQNTGAAGPGRDGNRGGGGSGGNVGGGGGNGGDGFAIIEI